MELIEPTVRVFNNVKNAYNSSYMKKRTSIFY